MTIYLLFAILVLIIGISIASKNKDDIQKLSAIITGAISLAIAIMVFPSRLLEEHFVVAILGSLRQGIVAIGMNVDGDVPFYLDMPDGLRLIYTIVLYALYVSGPIMASVFVLSLFRDIRERISYIGFKKIHVFSSLNDKSLAIGESIHNKDRKQMLVYCNGKDIDNDNLLNSARNIHALVLNKDEKVIHINKNKIYEFYQINEDIKKSLKDTLALCNKLIENKNYIKENVIVRVFVDDKYKDIINNIDSQYQNKIYLRYIDENNSLAYKAISMYKDTFINNEVNNILVIGDSDLSISIIKNATSILTIPNHTKTINLICKEASNISKRLHINNPELDKYDINFFECEAYDGLDVLDPEADIDAVYVTYDDDELNYKVANNIKRFYGRNNENLSYPDIYCLIKDKDINKIISDNNIKLFGNYGDIYNYDNLIMPEYENEAKNIHLAYLNNHETDQNKINKILNETGYYAYTNQESSFAATVSMEYKLAYILSFKDKDISDKEFVNKWLKDENNLKSLGDSEHDRWMAYQRMNGWSLPSVKQEKNIAKKYEGNKVKDDELLLHPALVENNKLLKAEKKADEILSEYPSKKKTRYTDTDIYIIKKIVDILEIK